MIYVFIYMYSLGLSKLYRDQVYIMHHKQFLYAWRVEDMGWCGLWLGWRGGV